MSAEKWEPPTEEEIRLMEEAEAEEERRAPSLDAWWQEWLRLNPDHAAALAAPYVPNPPHHDRELGDQMEILRESRTMDADFAILAVGDALRLAASRIYVDRDVANTLNDAIRQTFVDEGWESQFTREFRARREESRRGGRS